MVDTERGSRRAWWWNDMTATDWRNLRRFLVAVAAWAVSFVGGEYLLRGGVVSGAVVSWVVAALPGVLGILAIVAYARYLRQTDELQRQTHLSALALGFGGGWLAVAGYRLFEFLGAPVMDRGGVMVVMAVVFTAGLLLARRRYV